MDILEKNMEFEAVKQPSPCINTKSKLFPSVRLGMVVLWFTGAVCIYMIRVNFSITLVCMTRDPWTNDTRYNDDNITVPWLDYNKTETDVCRPMTNAAEMQRGGLEWSRQTRGVLNSAFYFGYVVSQIPGGWLTQQYGAKKIHLYGTMLAALASWFSAVSVRGGPWTLFLARFINGVGSGFFVPSTTALINNWAPRYETTTLYSLQASGYSFGSVCAFLLSGVLCDYAGWPSTLYVPSAVISVYLIMFVIFTTSNPESQRWISQREKTYITEHRQAATSSSERIPWRAIFTSVPCWALFVSEFFSAWGAYMTLSSGAQYMKDVLKFDIKSNGAYNALPQLVKFLTSILAGIFIDTIRRRKLLSATNSRRLAETLGMVLPAGLILCLSFMTCETRTMAVMVICMAEAFDGFGRTGISVNIMEVAPRFTGILVGILNTFSTAGGIVCPIVVGLLTTHGSKEEWMKVFYLGVGVYMCGWLIFVTFTSAEPQEWSKPRGDQQREGQEDSDEMIPL